MKKAGLLIASMSLAIATVVVAQNEKKPVLSPKATAQSSDVMVTYGQPSMRGRKIFGELVPYGKVWRTGANEATTITFKKNGMFGGKEVKAGTYTLFTIPTEQKWTVILNSKLGQWGAYGYDSTKIHDVLQVTVPVKHLSQPVEKLTISTTNKELDVKWENTEAIVPMKF